MENKNYLKMILGGMLAVMVTYNVYHASDKKSLPDLLLANIEVLANNGENDDKTWTAPRTIPCDYQHGPWHTASIERICEFCVTPNSCTPRACGE